MNGETEDETRQERNTQQEQGQGQPKSPPDGRQSAWKFLYQTDPKLSEPSYGRMKDRRKREKERREKEEKKGGGEREEERRKKGRIGPSRIQRHQKERERERERAQNDSRKILLI